MNEWTNEMSGKAIYAVMERCGMLQNMTLLGELKKLESAMHQAFKPTWGGANDPDALKMQLAEQEEFRVELQRICEDGKHVQIQHPTESGWFILSIHDAEDGPACIWGRRVTP